MLKKQITAVLFASFFSLTIPVLAYANVDDELRDLRGGAQTTNEWELIKYDSRRNIKAYSKREDGKRIRSFKLEYLIDAPFMTLARVYLDVDNYTRWFWEVREAKVVKKVSDTEFYYYIIHEAPVTLPDRDAIIHVTVDPYDAKKGYASLKLKAVPDFLPQKPPLVRMLAEDMTIKFTPLNKKQVKVDVDGYIDPGGLAPTWAINFIQKQAPYFTVIGLQRMVQQAQFRDSTEPLPYRLLNEEWKE